MPTPTACPDDATFYRFLAGALTDEVSEPVSDHVAACPSCSIRVAGLLSRDPLVAALRSSRTGRDLEADPDLGAILVRVRAALGTTPPHVPATLLATPKQLDAAIDLSDYRLERPQLPDEIGRVGRFRLLAVLGRGGMGVVFRAEDTDLRRQVAVKVMNPSVASTRSGRERFLREARAAGRLHHDHVVPVYHVGESGGTPYIVMPLLAGETLQSRLAREPGGRLPVAEALRVGREIAAALAAAHATGLVHRDIKPANVWLEAPTGRVKVLDFGLARDAAGPGDGLLTRTDDLLGTPAYMAPEQADGRPTDARCDLFSLGVILYELTTGVRPFVRPTIRETLHALATHTPPPASTICPDIPRPLAHAIGRLLTKDPTDRPQSAIGVCEVFARFEAGSPKRMAVAVTPVVLQQVPVRVPRLALGVAAAVSLAGVIVGVVVMRPPPGPQPDRAPEPSPGAGLPLLPPVPSGAPLVPYALVTRPAARPGVQSWELLTVLPYTIDVSSVRPSPDGKWLAVPGLPLRIFDLQSYRLVQAFYCHSPTSDNDRSVNVFAWSPDGTQIAMDDGDSLLIWEVNSGRAVRRFQVKASRICWSPKGDRLVAFERGDTRIFDLKSGVELEPIVRFNGFSISPDGTLIAGWTAEGATVVDLASGKPLPGFVTFPYPNTFATASSDLAWTPDQRRIAVGLPEIQILDAASGAVECRLKTSGFQGRLTWRDGGKRLQYTHGIFDVSEEKLVVSTSSVTALLNDKLAVSFNAGILSVVDAATGKTVHDFGVRTPILSAYQSNCTLSHDGSRLALGKYVLLNARNGQLIADLYRGDYSGEPVHSVFTPDGQLITGYKKGGGFRSDRDGKHLANLTGALSLPVNGLVLSADGTSLAGATVGEPRKLAFHDLVSGKVRPLIDLEKNTNLLAAWSPDGSRLAFATPVQNGADAPIHIWNVSDNRLEKSLGLSVSWEIVKLEWSPDGKYIHNGASVWDVDANAAIPLAGRVVPETWSPDGNFLYAFDPSKPSTIIELPWSDTGTLKSRTIPVPFTPGVDFARTWSADRKYVSFIRNGFVTLAGLESGIRATFIDFGSANMLVVNDEGHSRQTKPLTRSIAYLVRTDSGQTVLTAEEFEVKHGFVNDPDRVCPVNPDPRK